MTLEHAIMQLAGVIWPSRAGSDVCAYQTEICLTDRTIPVTVVCSLLFMSSLQKLAMLSNRKLFQFTTDSLRHAVTACKLTCLTDVFPAKWCFNFQNKQLQQQNSLFTHETSPHSGNKLRITVSKLNYVRSGQTTEAILFAIKTTEF